MLSTLQTCENLTLISRVSNLSPAGMTEDYLKPEIPVIVTDAMTDWPAVLKFSVTFLDEVSTDFFFIMLWYSNIGNDC